MLSCNVVTVFILVDGCVVWIIVFLARMFGFAGYYVSKSLS